MNIKNLFRPRWQHNNANIRLAAIAKITNKATLGKIAERSDDERLRLEAARRLHHTRLLKQLAQSASDDAIRLEAAIAVQDQACLSAIALSCWSIAQGQTAVHNIHIPLVLMRVARSAKQDAVRLSAALKLNDPKLLRLVARSSNQIDVHWQVARRLNDPRMMADIAMHKPGNVKVAPMRRKARQALMTYLNQCQRNHDNAALKATIHTSPHLTFKLEAFVRLSPDQITMPLLLYLASQDMHYIPKDIMEKLISQIKHGGWRIWPTIQKTPCIHCQGSGTLTLRSGSANDTWIDHDGFPCPECEGEGERLFRRVTCERNQGETVIFRFPEDG